MSVHVQQTSKDLISPSKIKKEQIEPHEKKKNALSRLLSNMVVTITSKPDLDFYVTLMTNQHEAISFSHFMEFFHSMEQACEESLVYFKSHDRVIESLFSNYIQVEKYINGQDSKWSRSKVKSRLLFKDPHSPGALQFTLLEKSDLQEQKLGENPYQKNIYQRWTFVHRSQIKYEFFQQVSGATKQTACDENLQYFVRMSFINLHTLVSQPNFIDFLLKKSFEIFGHGPKPELVHYPLRHKSRKPEPGYSSSPSP
jgi:hypothetical protein